jgi:hypothetical protein
MVLGISHKSHLVRRFCNTQKGLPRPHGSLLKFWIPFCDDVVVWLMLWVILTHAYFIFNLGFILVMKAEVCNHFYIRICKNN